MPGLITSDGRVKITAQSHPQHWALGKRGLQFAILGLVLRFGAACAFALLLLGCVLGTFGVTGPLVLGSLFVAGPLTLVLMIASRAARLRARAYGRRLQALPKPE